MPRHALLVPAIAVSLAACNQSTEPEEGDPDPLLEVLSPEQTAVACVGEAVTFEFEVSAPHDSIDFEPVCADGFAGMCAQIVLDENAEAVFTVEAECAAPGVFDVPFRVEYRDNYEGRDGADTLYAKLICNDCEDTDGDDDDSDDDDDDTDDDDDDGPVECTAPEVACGSICADLDTDRAKVGLFAVLAQREIETEVPRGENAGKRLTEHWVVRDFAGPKLTTIVTQDVRHTEDGPAHGPGTPKPVFGPDERDACAFR